MSDRFYMQQYDRTGWKPVWNNTWIQKTHRRKRMAWTDESKAEAVQMYQDSEPTPETSITRSLPEPPWTSSWPSPEVIESSSDSP